MKVFQTEYIKKFGGWDRGWGVGGQTYDFGRRGGRKESICDVIGPVAKEFQVRWSSGYDTRL